MVTVADKFSCSDGDLNLAECFIMKMKLSRSPPRVGAREAGGVGVAFAVVNGDLRIRAGGVRAHHGISVALRDDETVVMRPWPIFRR